MDDPTSVSLPPDIYIVGAQSTGKTTLVNALATFFHTKESEQKTTHMNNNNNNNHQPDSQPRIIKEVARSVLLKHNLTAADITHSPSSALRVQRLILEAQVEVETETRRAGQWYISDRSALDPLVYADVHSGKDGLAELCDTPAWKTAARWMAESVVIVCEAGAGEWLVDDGVRLMPNDRQGWVAMHQRFCGILDGMDIAYTVLPSEMVRIEDRVEVVVKRWHKECGISVAT